MKKFILLLFLVFSANAIAQNTYIPYRKAQLWGLADTLGKIKLEPQFDSLQYRGTDYNDKIRFQIYKGVKTGFTSNEKIIIPTQYDSIDYNYKLLTAVKKIGKKNACFLYDNNGKLLNTKPYLSIEDTYESSVKIVETLPNLFSLIHFNNKGEKVYLLKDYYFIDRYSVLKTKTSEQKYYSLEYDESLDKVTILLDNMGKDIGKNAMGMDASDDRKNLSLQLREGKLALYDQNRNASKPVNITYDKVEFFDFPTESTWNNEYYRDKWQNYAILQRGSQKTLLLPNESTFTGNFDKVIPMNEKQYFKLQLGQKIGLLDNNCKQLLAIEYDEINENGIIKANGLYGIYNQYLKNDLITPKYDEIKILNNDYWNPSYKTHLANKYGYIDEYTFIDCLSDYPLLKTEKFNNYKVLKSYTESGKFLGYFDPKGFNYFEE